MRTALLIALLLPIGALAQRPRTTFIPIAPQVSVITTWNTLDNGEYYPANGLLIETANSVVLIDPGWGAQGVKDVMKHVRKLGKPIVAGIATHNHDDRTGGFPALQRLKVPCFGTDSLQALALKRGGPAPDHLLSTDTVLTIDGVRIHYWYPGPGHTRDNMVVWLPDQQVLFGGCLVKSTETSDLGYIDEADLEHWPSTIQAVWDRFPEAAIVVPGHQAWGSRDLLAHTFVLLGEHLHPEGPPATIRPIGR